jgi:hypothetical protein
MTRLVLLAALWPVVAHAQIALYTVSGTKVTLTGTVYDYGNVATGINTDVRFRIENTGSASVLLTSLSLSGNSFSIVEAPSFPYTLAPENFLEFTVRCAPVSTGSFSAALLVNSQSNSLNVQLMATAVSAPVLIGLPPCIPDLSVANQVDFASVQFGKTGGCNFSLQNPNAQPLVVSSITIAGSGFQLSNLPGLPATIPAGSATDFAIQITPVCGISIYAGTLTVVTQAITQTFLLAGAAFAPPLPKPGFSFNPDTLASGEQVTLTMSLPSPYPCPALFSGYVNLAFTPETAVVPDDPAIVFLPGSTRTLPLALNADGTQVFINGQASAIFQTGTTAGSITFSITTTGVQLNANPTTVVSIPPAVIAVETAAASNQQMGVLNIEVTAVDNTYTAGVMSFAFFDTNGKTIGSGAMNVDFTSNFKAYFAGLVLAGRETGAFLMNVSFPVTGNALNVGSVKVTLSNSAGQTQTGSLAFQ